MVVHPCNPSIWDTRQEEQEFRVVHSYLKVLGSPGIHKTRFKFFLKTERRRGGVTIRTFGREAKGSSQKSQKEIDPLSCGSP